jgi:quinol monooxygenase YgiN
MAIYITVILKAKEEFIQDLKNNLIKLVKNSSKEKGCLQYDLHQSTAKPDVFVLHEQWENQGILDLHNAQEYLKNFFAIAADLISEPIEVIFTNKIA